MQASTNTAVLSPDELVWRAEPERIQPSRAAQQGGADPVMVRAYCGGHKGATAFFRNRPLLDVATEYLAKACPTGCRILFQACSVGAEPYSFALWWRRHAIHGAVPLTVDATDIEPSFVELARGATYPVGILDGMTDREKAWFDRSGDEVRVPDDVRKCVNLLPARSFADEFAGEKYDAIFIMNALTYVSPELQHVAIQQNAGQARFMLGLTAFHPDSIVRDITTVGFMPYGKDAVRIHKAWGDRLHGGPLQRGTPEYSWKLPPFDTRVAGYQHRFSSLFVRR